MKENSLVTPEFKVHYDEVANTLQLEGNIRLLRSVLVERFNGLLARSLDFQTSLVLWDLSRVVFLDSTAEQCLYALLAAVRHKDSLVVRIYADDNVRIQQKVIPNLKQFFPAADVYYVQA